MRGTSTAIHEFRPGWPELYDRGTSCVLLDRVASLRSRTAAPVGPVTGTRLRIRVTSAETPANTTQRLFPKCMALILSRCAFARRHPSQSGSKNRSKGSAHGHFLGESASAPG